MNNNQSTDTNMGERIAKLEERVDGGLGYINRELAEIKNNHLHTLQTDVTDLKMKVNTLNGESECGSSNRNNISRFSFRYLLK
jgi:hypothetical protein